MVLPNTCIYCDMERSCKGVGGGWMRVASVNMTDSSNSCPSGLRTLIEPRRLCAMNIDGAGCSSVVLPVEGVQYSRVSLDTSSTLQMLLIPTIMVVKPQLIIIYVDGISLTYGSSPRQHIWTFVAAQHTNYPPPAVPPFVGDDYFCDTGSETPLWDGEGCGQFSTCCSTILHGF